MYRHPELGARILSGHGLEDIRSWVIAHHERPDGKGYPKGLTKAEIPIEAAVIAACDAFEAMVSNRVYREAIGTEAACEELRANAGTQFEPAVVEALLSIVSSTSVMHGVAGQE
jgi:HD-GYP domain-containing protein (c-di-GMP phosphodiesterase class II)